MDNAQLESIQNPDTTASASSFMETDPATIDTADTGTCKTTDSIESMKSPYCFLCGDIPVNVRFVSDRKTLAQSLSDYFIRLK